MLNGNENPQLGNDDVTTSPCTKATSLSRNAALKERVNELFQTIHKEISGDTENGWIKTTTGEYIYPSERYVTSMKYNPSDLIGKKITEQYHCHPSLGTFYPSMSDLKSLATRYKNGNIDVNNFTYGVISVGGCLSIMITSEEAFRSFADKVLNGDEKLNRDYKLMYNTKATSNEMAVAKFIDFLKLSISGLNVMFNEPSFDSDGTPSLGNWRAKDSGGNANLSNYNCK